MAARATSSIREQHHAEQRGVQHACGVQHPQRRNRQRQWLYARWRRRAAWLLCLFRQRRDQQSDHSEYASAGRHRQQRPRWRRRCWAGRCAVRRERRQCHRKQCHANKKNNATLADGRFGRETDVAGPAADLTRSLVTRNGLTLASVDATSLVFQKIGERLSFRDPGRAHAFIRALAPGEIGRIVGRWA